MSETHQPPPDALLFQSLVGFMVSKSLSAVAELVSPTSCRLVRCPVENLPEAVHADERFLCRVMRLLVSAGSLPNRRRAPTRSPPCRSCYVQIIPPRLRDLAAMLGSESHWQPWGQLPQAILYRHVRLANCLRHRRFLVVPASGKQDSVGLVQRCHDELLVGHQLAVADSYDFSRFRNIVDIGGGHGFLLRAVLAKAPNAKGTLFDFLASSRGTASTPWAGASPAWAETSSPRCLKAATATC